MIEKATSAKCLEMGNAPTSLLSDLLGSPVVDQRVNPKDAIRFMLRRTFS